eukprot:12888587-Prorocentrum_lima.AAC.1
MEAPHGESYHATLPGTCAPPTHASGSPVKLGRTKSPHCHYAYRAEGAGSGQGRSAGTVEGRAYGEEDTTQHSLA